MWLQRDLSSFLSRKATLPAQVVWGPRQCGKSTLLGKLSVGWQQVSLDELQYRDLAHRDPALFFRTFPIPVVIDEAQYAPSLFSHIKLMIDQMRAQRKITAPLFRLTGSHQILLDLKIKESLGGRASYFRLHNLSLQEAAPLKMSPEEFLFKGGWPEMLTTPELNPIDYLNDYIRTVIEKDVALASGITLIDKFNLCLSLLANRVGELINFESIGREAGVSGLTLKSWIFQLERSGLAGLLKPFHSNLNKRLIKAPKFYFLDTGLATRLQGHQDVLRLMRSPSFGHLFENLVLTEIVKTRDHHRRDWSLFFWRTKEQEEYDFVIQTAAKVVVIDAQVAIQSALPICPSKRFRADFASREIIPLVCSLAGRKQMLSNECWQVPVTELGEFLLENLL